MKKLSKLLLITLLLFILPGCARKHNQQVLSADNVTISYHLQGQGKPALVFIHGSCCDKSFWKFQVPHFAKRYQVVTIDLAGHGESGLGRADYTIEAFGSDVVAVVEKLQLDEVILVGHSLGGPVIIEAARQMPERVIGCVAVDTLHDIEKGYDDEELKAIASRLKVDFTNTVQNFVRGVFRADANPEIVEWVTGKMSSIDPEVAIGIMENVGQYDLKRAVKDVQVPIVCINSDFWPTKVKENRKYAKIYEVKIMPGIGHVVMMEEPDKFNQLLAETIAELRKTNYAEKR
jgi:pimeloyl-ACP methyl ester carboxylesterase